MTSVAPERSDGPFVRVLEGDEPAYAQPVRRDGPALLRVALSYVRSSAITERCAKSTRLPTVGCSGRVCSPGSWNQQPSMRGFRSRISASSAGQVSIGE